MAAERTRLSQNETNGDTPCETIHDNAKSNMSESETKCALLQMLARKLLENQEDVPREFLETVDKHFWDLF